MQTYIKSQKSITMLTMGIHRQSFYSQLSVARTGNYCGVNAHHQNGIAKKRIWDLQEKACGHTTLHSEQVEENVSIALWSYTLCTANEVHNSTPLRQGEKSPLELFSQVEISPKLKHFHAFGSPAYVLDNRLEMGASIPKQQARACLGIYLGPSPNHARSVSLVLNPRMGHVSPQFHIRHNTFFETVMGKPTDFDLPDPFWKQLAQLDSSTDPSTILDYKQTGKTNAYKAMCNTDVTSRPPINDFSNNLEDPSDQSPAVNEVENVHLDPPILQGSEGDEELLAATSAYEETINLNTPSIDIPR